MPVKVNHFVALEFSSINIFFFSSAGLSCYLLSLHLKRNKLGKMLLGKEPICLFSSVFLSPGKWIFKCSHQSLDAFPLWGHFSTWSFAGKHEIILFELWAYVHSLYASLDGARCWAQTGIFCLSAGALAGLCTVNAVTWLPVQGCHTSNWLKSWAEKLVFCLQNTM